MFLESGCIKNKEPATIAQFLLTTEGLDKVMLGDFLGDG